MLFCMAHYMEQPPRFVHPIPTDHVCLLWKSLYSLRQAPRTWFEKFSNFLLESGFFCSTTDPSLFVFHKGQDTILLLFYVDGILLTGNSDYLLAQLIKSLDSTFHMQDLGCINMPKTHSTLGLKLRFLSKFHLFTQVPPISL